MTPSAPPPKEPPKYVTYKMRCGRTVLVLNTPDRAAAAKRMGWTLVVR